jgi:hypothetical protein
MCIIRVLEDKALQITQQTEQKEEGMENRKEEIY